MASYLRTPIEYLKGVGTARADLLKKELNIFTFGDLLHYYPFRYIDRSRIYKIQDIRSDLPYIQLLGRINSFRTEGQKRGKRLIANFVDDSGELELVWFKGIKWITQYLNTSTYYVIFGKPNLFNGSYSIIHPTVEKKTEYQTRLYSTAVQPFYNTTEKLKARNIDSKVIMQLSNNLLSDPKLSIEDNLPQDLLDRLQLPKRSVALKNIHFPSDAQTLEQARKRLKFEELFFIQLKLLRYKLNRTKDFNGIAFQQIGAFFNEFYEQKLPFELTGAQKRVLKEIREDVRSGKQMNRLLQGDVGSGKTIVALMSMLMALDNGYQACLMAPTEILATQHYEGIRELLKDMNVNIRLLTGSTVTKERKEIASMLEDGSLHILVGTHALIENQVQFQNLGLVIIDEQHRFGVKQRAKLWEKNRFPPHILVMTATPIPRTLAMTLYGDLDTSVIDELPAGRKPIKTSLNFDSQRLKVFGFLRKEIALGRQVYIVYPLIEESEKMDYKSLMDGFEAITRSFPAPDYHVSIVHGKMKAADKDFEMKRFIKGETNIMVATTVIEVGVNVPNASVMIIESAERFGLSQLHQLRGRVGRGAEQSYCILMAGDKLSNDARTRMQTMVRTSDGFEIAEADLKLRGPGDMEGTRQSGTLDLKLADLAQDSSLVQQTRALAIELLEDDPELTQAKHQAMATYLQQNYTGKKWSKIS